MRSRSHQNLFPLLFRPLTLLVAGAVFLNAGAAAQGGGKEVAKHQPVVPGFERFYTGPNTDLVEGGRLLLAELNCTSCHAVDNAHKALLLPRQAPILTDVGSRVKHGFLKKFLSNPHEVKPGTAMPDVFAAMPAQEKAEKVEALAHLLASTGTLAHEALKPNMVAKGQILFHEAGCVACHGSRDVKGNAAKVLPTSIPLTHLKEKYSLPGLSAFLEAPHQARPSGRMPGLLDATGSREVASYLLQGIPGPPPNLAFGYYEGNWDKVPNFKNLTPKFKGECSGFDLTLASRGEDYAMRFEGYFKANVDGEYRFWLNSDDGSQLWLDGKLVVNNDGVHAPKTATGAAKLTKGMHQLEVGFFQVGGGAELHVEVQGPKQKRQAAAPHVFLTPEGNPVTNVKKDPDENFAVKPELVEKGKAVFMEMGCANCHEMKIGGKEFLPRPAVTPLAKLKASGGCLSTMPVKDAPHYDLTPAQSKALAAAIKDSAKPLAAEQTVQQTIHNTLVTFNCYACHARGPVGGVEQPLNGFFKTAQPEMGDEGRIPPALDGVGAKLKKTYMQHLFAKGAHDRPYMFTHMPKFGMENVGPLVEAFAKVDTLAAVNPPAFKEKMVDVKKEARHMVGAKAFGCIKCHTFAGKKAEGVQGIDMTLMTERVNHDWFHDYLLNPQKFRPGTRMPTSWPGGQTQLPKVLGGDTDKQIEAIWVYLSDGKKAATPVGVGSAQYIELVPDKNALIYRNFIAGGGSRAIGVGYPEHANICFDANKLALAMIWQGAFMDASKHWTDRGVGYQPPLGENVMNLPTEVPFAALDKDSSPWPKESAKQLGYKFHGYQVGTDDRPTFHYTYKTLQIEDFPNATDGKLNPVITRKLTLTATQPTMGKLWYRAAAGGKIEKLEKDVYVIDGKLKVRIEAATAPIIRQASVGFELVVPVEFKNKQAEIVQQYMW